MPGQYNLLEKEKQLLKPKEEVALQEKPKVNKKDDAAKKNKENLEAAFITIAKRKRHKDPKSRCRGLATSTMPRPAESDGNEDKEHFDENTDYPTMKVNFDDEKGMKKKKERLKRRREKRHREKTAACRDRESDDSGIDGAHGQRPYDSEDEEQEVHPLGEGDMLVESLQASASLQQQKNAEQAIQAKVEAAPSRVDDKLPQMSKISGDDLDDKSTKRKKKHKKQKNI